MASRDHSRNDVARQEAPGVRLPASWVPAAVAVLGLISLLLIFTTDRLRQELLERDIVFTRTVADIENGLAIAHLWIEEYLHGDEREIDRVGSNLARSARLTRTLLEGGALDDGARMRAVSDSRLSFHLRQLSRLIEEFGALSRARLEAAKRGERVGPGSASDVEFDRVFAEAFLDTQALKTLLGVRLARNHERSRFLLWGILFAWVAIVGTALTGLASRERRRRQAEIALRESREQLLQAQKMDAIGRLAGGIAHDINNYLAAIMSTCELAKIRAEPGSRLADQMNTVIGTVLRASALIRRLLAFSRNQPVQPQVVDLNRIVSDLGAMLHRLLGEDILLETSLEAGLWPVRIDPSQLEQVLVNLAVNAREAMPAGGRLVIATRKLSAGAARAEEAVQLAVRDEGPGIPEEIRSRIFEPFFSTKQGGTGSGLGLATVYAVIAQAGGTTSVASEVGRGTTFTILLPRSREAASAPEAAAGAPAPRGAETLLLVEDSPELRLSTRELLAGMGYRILAARDGPHALRLLVEEGREVRLVLTDIVMPGMSGPELADRIRALRPDVEILFMSGYAADVIAERGLATAGLEILRKPFTAAQLSARVRQRLDGRHSLSA